MLMAPPNIITVKNVIYTLIMQNSEKYSPNPPSTLIEYTVYYYYFFVVVDLPSQQKEGQRRV